MNFSCARPLICPFHPSSSVSPIPSSSSSFSPSSISTSHSPSPNSPFPSQSQTPQGFEALSTHPLPMRHTHISCQKLARAYTHTSTDSFILAHTNTNLSASSLYPASPSISQMCPHPMRKAPLHPKIIIIIKKTLATLLSSHFSEGGEDELMNVVGLMWMRGEQLKSSLLSFPFRSRGKTGETEIVSGMSEKKKKPPKIYLISIRETYFKGWIKAKKH